MKISRVKLNYYTKNIGLSKFLILTPFCRWIRGIGSVVVHLRPCATPSPLGSSLAVRSEPDAR